jgi:DNA-binding CsgD family transcriptional regulator
MPSPPGRASSPSLTALGLTERQREVLALMMEGKSNKEICRVLDLAEPTVKYHVAAILKILKVANRTEAVLVAVKLSSTTPQVGKLGAEATCVDASVPVKIAPFVQTTDANASSMRTGALFAHWSSPL